MNYTQLTKRESQIMTILWNHDQEMSANDIKLASDGLSIYTISQALQYLLSIGYVEVTGIGKNKKSIARLYSPCISESDYVSSFIKKETFEEIAVHYVQSSNDIDEITKLEHLIEKDTFNKLGYKTKINTHTTSCINLFLDIYLYSEYRLIYC